MLVELVVSLAILGVVMATATALFLSVMGGQLQVRADVAIIESLRTAMESMTREVRAGRSFQYNNAAYGAQSLAFVRTLETGPNITVVYRRNPADNSLERSGDGGATYGKITSPTVAVTGLTFQPDPGGRSRVMVAARVRANQGRLGEFFFSTSVAPRNVRYTP